jgi:hypothetical protein
LKKIMVTGKGIGKLLPSKLLISLPSRAARIFSISKSLDGSLSISEHRCGNPVDFL